MKKILIILCALFVIGIINEKEVRSPEHVRIIKKGKESSGEEFIRYLYKDREYYESSNLNSIKFLENEMLKISAFSTDKESYTTYIVFNSDYFIEKYDIDMKNIDSAGLYITNQNGTVLIDKDYELKKNNKFVDALYPNFHKMIVIGDKFINKTDTYNISIKVDGKMIELCKLI